MKQKTLISIAILNIVLIAACTHKEAAKDKAASSSSGASWALEMKNIENQMLYLLEKTADVEKFKSARASSKEVDKIKHSFEVLKHKAELLESKSLQPDKDPTLSISARIFKNNVHLASDSFFTENYDFSKATLHSALGQCVQCHTRLEYGPQFQKEKWNGVFDKVGVVDQIQLSLATRNYQLAEKKIDEFLRGQLKASSIFDWQDVVNLGFVLHVRFNNDSVKTKKLLNLIDASSHIPPAIKRNITYWQQSTTDWESQRNDKITLKSVDQWIKKGDQLNTQSRAEGGMIYYLRASRWLHENIAFTSNDKTKNAEILYRLGLVNSVFRTTLSQSMYEDYFELCIKDVPHTELSKKCYAQLEKNLTQRYTGRLEKELPFDIKTRLSELSILAK